MNYLQDNITYLKKKKGVTNASIALQVNKSNNTISNWITGVAEPGLTELQILSQFLDVSLDYLINKDLSKLNLTENDSLEKTGEKLNPNLNLSLNLNKKKARNEPCQDCMVKDNFIAVNQQLLQAKTQLIESQEAQIKLLQNQIEQMKYEIDERRQTQYSKKKEQKSA